MKFRHIILALALAVGFAACGDDKDEPKGLGDDLTVRKTMTLAADAPQELSIKAPAQPTLTADEQWLHVSGATLKGGTRNIYTATVQADINPTAEVRTAKITVTCGSETAVVTVSQRAGEVVEIVSIEPSTELAPTGGKLTVTYTATSALTVTVPEWMTFSNDAAASVLTLNYQANTGAARTGEVVLAINDNVKTSFAVSQGITELMLGKTAKEIIGDMYAGINIGNTLEAPGSETGWVKTLINPTYIAGLKNLGFNAVRVPCAWDSHVSDPANNTIDPAWLDRVDEVIGYIVGNGMYAIVNIHWDGGWLENT